MLAEGDDPWGHESRRSALHSPDSGMVREWARSCGACLLPALPVASIGRLASCYTLRLGGVGVAVSASHGSPPSRRRKEQDLGR